jgi:type I restriction enzyme, S subunit
MKDWQTLPLGDALTFQRGFDITKGEQRDGPYPVISSSGAKTTHAEFKVHGPGVVIGRKGSLGTVFYSEGNYWPHDTTLWIKNFHGNHPRFAYYFLQTMGFERLDAGASNPSLNRNHIHTIPVSWPPLPLQRRIAGILSAYDELIENSQRRIRILEDMARALYREWFVHFRFLGHERHPRIASTLGHIPRGWEVKTVEEIVERIPVGKKYEQKTVTARGAVPVLDQGKSGIIGYHDDEPGVVASENAPVIVFANHTCYQRLIHFAFSAIQNVLPFVPRPSFSRNIYWLHWATNGLVVFNDYKGHWPEFAGKTLIVPPADLCQRFGDFAAPVSRQILKLERQIQNLRRTRDLLLPRLLLGQITL